MFRDRLTESERIVLDVYREKLEHYLKSQTSASGTPTTTAPAEARTPSAIPGRVPFEPEGAASDAQVVTTSTSVRSPASPAVDPVQALSRRPDETNESMFKDFPDSSPMPQAPSEPLTTPRGESTTTPIGATAAWRDTADTKQKGRWLLELAREQIRKGHFDIAEQAITEARGLDIKWTMFDETPDRMTDALKKARAKTAPKATDPVQSHDRRAAKARLKESRAALAANDLDRAEELVREVRSWNVSYGLFDDTPDKVASAILEVRRREAVRDAELMVRTYYRGDGKTATGRSPQATPADTSDSRGRSDPN
jgi:hypothetical protein